MRTLILAGLLLSSLTASAAPSAAQEFRLIVHTDNRLESVSPGEAADLFLKKTLTWPDGAVASPVDLSADAAVREQFSRAVLRRSVAQVKTFWQQQVFRGRDVPPPELPSIGDVLEFVRRTPGAVAYVPSDLTVGPGIRVLSVR